MTKKTSGRPISVLLLVVWVSFGTCQDLKCSNAVADIVFLADQSSSIGVDRWPLVQNFFCEIATAFDVALDKVRIGMVTFDRKCNKIFNLNTHSTKEGVCSDIMAIEYDEGYTNIACALEQASNLLSKAKFGDREDVVNVVLLLSDGDPNRDVNLTIPEANNLKDIATLVVVALDEIVNTTFMKDLASSQQYFYFVKSFVDLVHSVANISAGLCYAAGATPDLNDPCYRCSDYDDAGFGFIGDANSSLCHQYWLCNQDPYTKQNVRTIKRTCPPGTVYSSQSSVYGIPCVHEWQANTTQCVEPPTYDTSVITPGSCPYELSGVDDSIFWIRDYKGDLVVAGHCRTGALFDTGVCDCLGGSGICECLLDITFEGDFNDHSCREGYVSMEGPVPVISVTSGPFGDAGYFSGRVRSAKNGAHLKAWSLNGAFSNRCSRGGRFQLSVSVWFNAAGPLTRDEGLVTYADCQDEDPSFYIWLRSGQVCAGLNTHGYDLVEICMPGTVMTGVWYYASMVFDMPELLLYVTSADDYFTCKSGTPAPTCAPAAQANQRGCVESRNCGLQVGFTGTEYRPKNVFFKGFIDEVEVSDGAEYEACLP